MFCPVRDDREATRRRFTSADLWACAPQGEFLARLGIGERAAQLAAAKPGEAGAVADALERLPAANQMGTLFKALAAWPAGQPTPPGFEETA